MGNRKNVEDYLKEGIYGEKETLPEERKKFLGTIRERIVAALTNDQVMEAETYPEVTRLLHEHPDAKLLLNGALDYSYLSKYIKEADKSDIPFSIVEKKGVETDIGLVLAYDHAINQKEIYIKKQKKEPEKPKKNGLSSLFSFWKD
ncbi:hypothetical protein BpJC7_05600 [Weizmannia acidilactici]|uniref:DUF1694 domain-containing protein n=1 Tax=Weizmannia acidilactici TaxID=2607726 RepID=A0A5J4JFF8_9BACI|nr:YueI family protein [Weizmannia acidilactici]GER66107.1 hypothetical protein BpJC4_05780 [Weizmannia acidilactici]GER69257.1 hypothetical protein BpJC7_05600 [Weizmannia acidilactici]GER72416.1 hypothetical protein BpPP18_04830 [Weizmannia acidilactici]